VPKPEEVSQFSILSSPTSRRSILLINSALRASAAFMSVVVWFKVLVFDPKTTVPPTTAAIAPIMTVALNPIAPTIVAKIRIPPAPAANFERRMIFRQLSNVRELLNVCFNAQYLFLQVTVFIKSTLHHHLRA
jgi:hypothetical protein